MRLFNKQVCDNLIKTGKPISHQASINPFLYNNLTEAQQKGYERGGDNLGYGYLYYGMVRIYKPRNVTAIGSGYGFVPMCLAHGIKDNNYGHVNFIDPSYHDSNCWSEPQKTKNRFHRVGIEEKWFTHYKMTNREYFKHIENIPKLRKIDLLFIDGADDRDNVFFDFYKFGEFVRRDGFILIHDTNHNNTRAYSEVKLVKDIKDNFPNLYDIIRLPGKSGVSILRRL